MQNLEYRVFRINIYILRFFDGVWLRWLQSGKVYIELFIEIELVGEI
jgi:hypothetical protein